MNTNHRNKPDFSKKVGACLCCGSTVVIDGKAYETGWDVTYMHKDGLKEEYNLACGNLHCRAKAEYHRGAKGYEYAILYTEKYPPKY